MEKRLGPASLDLCLFGPDKECRMFGKGKKDKGGKGKGKKGC